MGVTSVWDKKNSMRKDQKTSCLQTRWPVSSGCSGFAMSPSGDSCAGRTGVEEPGHPIGLPRPHGSSFLVPGETTTYNGIPGGSAIVRTLWRAGGLPWLSPSLLCIVSLSFSSPGICGNRVYIAIWYRRSANRIQVRFLCGNPGS